VLLLSLPYTAIIDTGSAISIIPDHIVQRLQLAPSPISPITMSTASGHLVPSSSSITIPTTATDGSFNRPITYYVAPPQMPLIIGMDTIRQGQLSLASGILSLSFPSTHTIAYPSLPVQTIDLDVDMPTPIDDFTSFLKSQNVPLNQLVDASLPAPDKAALLWTLQRNLHSFASNPKKPSTTTTIQHRIDTGTSPPLKQRPYRVPPSTATAIEQEVESMLSNGIIRPSHSPWSSPVLLVNKKDGSLRFCVDYRRLNKITTPDAFPMPIADDLFDRIGRASYFSSLDLASGYWQVPVDPADIPKTAFATTSGLYEFLVMPFGLCNAPQTFQRLMHQVLRGCEPFSAVYLDDIIIFSRSFQEHLDHIKAILNRIREFGLSLKLSKCRFGSTSAVFLGHRIENGKLLPLPEKIKHILQVATPANQDEVRAFLGLASYYRKFVRDFARRAEPLNQLLRSDTPFVWTDSTDAAFKDLKEALTSTPVLAQPDFGRTFQLYTDASNTALGAVLEQDGHPICYASRSLNQNERNYSATERECLAVLWAIAKFRKYLLGRRFTVFTDHHSLKWLLSTTNLSGRLARWSLTLQEYNMDIQHRPGRSHSNADALSRLPIASVGLDSISASQQNDPFCLDILKKLDPVTSTYLTGDSVYLLSGGTLYRQSKFLSKKRTRIKDSPLQLVVPKDLVSELLREYHDNMAHLGSAKTLLKLQQSFFWPNMADFVTDYIKKCDTCASMKSYSRLTRAELHPMPASFPMDFVTMDIVGPLPSTPSGNTYLLCIVDAFTKWPEAFPLHDTTAETIATVFVEQFVWRHGCPKRVLTDRGTNFNSELMKQVHNLLGAQPVFTSSYHPQTDGLTERFNRTIQDLITASGHKSDWDTALPSLLFAYRTSVHPSTKETPYFLLHGRDARLPQTLDLDHNSIRYDSLDGYTQHLVQTLLQTYPRVREALQAAASSQKRQYDKESTTVPAYKPGDRVWLFATTRAKFEPRWLGPYLVTEVPSPITLRLALPDYNRLHPTVHVNRVKPYLGSKPVEQPDAPVVLEPREVMEQSSPSKEKEYEVERIIRHTPDPLTGSTRFRIRWKGYGASADTWEPPEHIPSTLITDYFIQNSRSSSSRRGGNVRRT
jgi:hypothetical protein